MALTKEIVEKWIYPDVSRDKAEIREDVLDILRDQATLADVTAERDALAARVLEIEELIAAEEKAGEVKPS